MINSLIYDVREDIPRFYFRDARGCACTEIFAYDNDVDAFGGVEAIIPTSKYRYIVFYCENIDVKNIRSMRKV